MVGLPGRVDNSLTNCKTFVSMKSARLPTVSAKERIVLELLVSSGAKYGLQLVDESRGRLKRGTVYVTLGRMEQKGLVESHHERSHARP